MEQQTLEQMNALVERISRLRAEETEKSDAKKAVTAELEKAEYEMIVALQNHELKNYRSPLGLASLVIKSSVSTPKTDEHKALFYAKLRELGEYDAMISVNSQKLNSWFKEKTELAKEQGEEFECPGLTEISESISLSFRRG